MQERILTDDEVLLGYDKVLALYPHVPSLSMWRAWEAAAYRQHHLEGRVLDVGCGDGRYFQLLWPELSDVVGVDLNSDVAEIAQRSGIYSKVHCGPAHSIPEVTGSFDHIFANCSLEHMDELDGVLKELHRCLRVGGTLLCSVVTNRFIEWAPLPYLLSTIGNTSEAVGLLKQFIEYHHLVNALPVQKWLDRFHQFHFVLEQHTPILPKNTSGLFLTIDNLWHINRAGGGELGDLFYPFLLGTSSFPTGFRKVLTGLLEMESDRRDCSGAVFLLRKP
jgi:SAM-dependent methyltransferase